MFLRNINRLTENHTFNTGVVLSLSLSTVVTCGVKLFDRNNSALTVLEPFTKTIVWLALGLFLFNGAKYFNKKHQQKIADRNQEKYNRQLYELQSGIREKYKIDKTIFKELMITTSIGDVENLKIEFNKLSSQQKIGFLELVFDSFTLFRKQTDLKHEPFTQKATLDYLKSQKRKLIDAYGAGAAAGFFSHHFPVEVSAKIASYLSGEDVRTLGLGCQLAAKTANEEVENQSGTQSCRAKI